MASVCTCIVQWMHVCIDVGRSMCMHYVCYVYAKYVFMN